MDEIAPAKINLTLHVLGKRPDGYHELESLVAFADFGDRLRFRPAAEDRLLVDGPFAEAVDGENLVLKAKRAVSGWLGREFRGEFQLTKNIPVAAGLGGGSSDAAAAIRILFEAYAESLPVDTFLQQSASIGADVPVCLARRASWMRGLGERVTPAPLVGTLPAVLVNPGVKLSTASVFKALAAPLYEKETINSHADSSHENFKNPEAAAQWLGIGRNDLEAPAIALAPAIDEVLNTLRAQEECLLARLSGSGPTCFGLFPARQAAKKAASEVAASHPDWWAIDTSLS